MSVSWMKRSFFFFLVNDEKIIFITSRDSVLKLKLKSYTEKEIIFAVTRKIVYVTEHVKGKDDHVLTFRPIVHDTLSVFTTYDHKVSDSFPTNGKDKKKR